MGVVCTTNTKHKDKSSNDAASKNESLSPQTKARRMKITENDTSSEFDITRKATTIKLEKDIRTLVALDSNVIIAGGDAKPEDIYSREKVIGKGSFGIVYLVKHRQLHKYFAMKIIKKYNRSKTEEESLKNEINILKRLDHPNILKINDFYSTKENYYIITEHCQEGELFNEIKLYAPFSEPLVGYYMKQILKAVCYCHSMNVIHRDLKPENILIVKRSKNGCHPIKIIDFGTATIFSKDKKENSVIGSSYYIAPEVLSRNYSEKCDMWSCGVIMYILLTGKPPFGGINDEEILLKVKKGKFDLAKYPWGVISNEAKDLIKKLIEVDPTKRLSAEDALQHPWFELTKLKAVDNMVNTIDPNRAINLVKNLKKYRTDNILRCAVIAYLVHNNTQIEQARDAIKLFNQIDANCDGKIVKEELLSGLQSYFKLPGEQFQTEVETIFNNIDTDHNGYIEYEEFIRAAIDTEYFLKDNFLKFAFNYFDRDASGLITLDEVTNLFYNSEYNKKSSEVHQQLKLSFEQVDINGDGTLSFEEFCQMMRNIINIT